MNVLNLLVALRIIDRQRLQSQSLLYALHLDKQLLLGLIAVCTFGLIILYSAEAQKLYMVFHQGIRLLVAFGLMIALAQVDPKKLFSATPWLYGIGILLLVAVMIVGDVGKGAQRWLDLGILRFQPSEILKLIIPMAVAWTLHRRAIPPTWREILICGVIILLPTLLTALQPDLGTAIILCSAGAITLFLAGLSWRFIGTTLAGFLALLPILWGLLHEYQKQRILTFLNPERDPLGAGYHIIQSKIAIGSGGFWGKGWLNGSQSHLNYLPEHATDFIFAVCSEEFGFLGCCLLLVLYGFIIYRGLQISMNAQDNFSRLLAGSLTVTFFLSIFINIGMVTGILPVVGLPLPLISYGGTSLVITLLYFGLLMSIATHRKLVGQ